MKRYSQPGSSAVVRASARQSAEDVDVYASIRSHSQDGMLFNGESLAGTWRLMIRNTWPGDNSPDTTSPDFCRVDSWALRLNGSIIGWFNEGGLFQSEHARAGTVYSKLHNGKIIPVQSGFNVGVSEDPPPLRSAGRPQGYSPLPSSS